LYKLFKEEVESGVVSPFLENEGSESSSSSEPDSDDVSQSLGIDERPPSDLEASIGAFVERYASYNHGWVSLSAEDRYLRKQLKSFLYRVVTALTDSKFELLRVLISQGSFMPVHRDHITMLDVAREFLVKPKSASNEWTIAFLADAPNQYPRSKSKKEMNQFLEPEQRGDLIRASLEGKRRASLGTSGDANSSSNSGLFTMPDGTAYGYLPQRGVAAIDAFEIGNCLRHLIGAYLGDDKNGLTPVAQEKVYGRFVRARQVLFYNVIGADSMESHWDAVFEESHYLKKRVIALPREFFSTKHKKTFSRQDSEKWLHDRGYLKVPSAAETEGLGQLSSGEVRTNMKNYWQNPQEDGTPAEFLKNAVYPEAFEYLKRIQYMKPETDETDA
jgi:hypothetical protein